MAKEGTERAAILTLIFSNWTPFERAKLKFCFLQRNPTKCNNKNDSAAIAVILSSLFSARLRQGSHSHQGGWAAVGTSPQPRSLLPGGPLHQGMGRNSRCCDKKGSPLWTDLQSMYCNTPKSSKAGNCPWSATGTFEKDSSRFFGELWGFRSLPEFY